MAWREEESGDRAIDGVLGVLVMAVSGMEAA